MRQYGYTREEFLAMTLEEIHPREDAPALRELVVNHTRCCVTMRCDFRSGGLAAGSVLTPASSYPFDGNQAAFRGKQETGVTPLGLL